VGTGLGVGTFSGPSAVSNAKTRFQSAIPKGSNSDSPVPNLTPNPTNPNPLGLWE